MKNYNVKNIFLNLLMLNGNKRTSEKLLNKSLKKIQKNFNQKRFNDLIKIGLINSSPVLFLRNIKRKRRRAVEFPFLLNPDLRLFYGLKFIIKSCYRNKNQPFYFKFKNELIDSGKKKSQSVKKKLDLHQDASLKKKFANYRWF